MNSKKRHTQTKNKSILYQLESLIKTLYPKYKTINPYEQYLKGYYKELPIEDLLLFKRLLRSITLLNHKERTQDRGSYLSSYADVLTTIELMSQYTINDKLLKSYTELKYIFHGRPFTKLQAARVLRKSIRYIERLLPLLYHLKLAEKTPLKQGSKHTYKLLDYQSSVYEPEIAFEAVSADFENVKEFIDLEYRT